MALKKTDKRAIGIVAAATGTGRTLRVPAFKQEQSNWCWDACYQMVFHFNGFSLSQCNIAQQVPWQTYGNCCGKPGCCNKTISSLQVSQGYTNWGYNYIKSSSAVSFNTVQTSIKASKIVEAGIRWAKGGGHLVLVVGYETVGGTFVSVNDPANTTTAVMTYGFLKAGYGQGEWKDSWYDIA